MKEENDDAKFPKLRPAILTALAWRVIGEVMRRHHASLDLRVQQFYPGLSPLGIMGLAPGRITSTWKGDTTQVCFHLGGGGNGLCSVRRQKSVESFVAPITEILTGTPSGELVDAIEVAAGWQHRVNQATTPPVLVARLIARFLERYMLAPEPYRASSGWIDNSNAGYPAPYAVEWLTALPEGRKAAQFADDHDRVDYALRFWLLHRSKPHGGPAASWSQEDGPAVVLDMATAECIPLHGPARVNMMSFHATHGRSMHKTLIELERLMEAP